MLFVRVIQWPGAAITRDSDWLIILALPAVLVVDPKLPKSGTESKPPAARGRLDT